MLHIHVIYQTRKNMFDHISNHQKRVENKKHSMLFLTNFEMFGNVVKHCLETTERGNGTKKS